MKRSRAVVHIKLLALYMGIKQDPCLAVNGAAIMIIAAPLSPTPQSATLCYGSLRSRETYDLFAKSTAIVDSTLKKVNRFDARTLALI